MPRVEFDSTKRVFERWKVLHALDGVITLKGSISLQGYEKTPTNRRRHCPAVLVIGQPTSSSPWSPSFALDIRRLLVHGVRLLH